MSKLVVTCVDVMLNKQPDVLPNSSFLVSCEHEQVRLSFNLLQNMLYLLLTQFFLKPNYKSQQNVYDHRTNNVIYNPGLMFCLEMSTTHVSYDHHFITLICFCDVVITLRMGMKKTH